jgi:peroxiredoxin
LEHPSSWRLVTATIAVLTVLAVGGNAAEGPFRDHLGAGPSQTVAASLLGVDGGHDGPGIPPSSPSLLAGLFTEAGDALHGALGRHLLGSDGSRDEPPPETPSSQTVLAGSLLGSEGTALPNGRVVVTRRLLEGDDVQVETVGKDGKFRVPLDTGGIMRVYFEAPHHERARILTYLEPGDTVRVNVTLSPIPLRDDLSGATVVRADSNAEDVPLTRQPDGAYAAPVPAPGDSLSYRVDGVRAAPDRGPAPAISGTRADRVVFRGRRGYQSVVAAPEDTVRVRFDPARLPSGEGEEVIQFEDSDGAAAQYYQFASRLKSTQRQLRSPTTTAGDVDWSKNREALRTALGTNPPDDLRNAYLVTYFRYTLRYAPQDSARARKMMDAVPPDSPLLAAMGGELFLFGRLHRATKTPSICRRYVRSVADAHPVDDVRAGALYHLLREAHRRDDSTQVQQYYSRLTDEYPNTVAARNARDRFDPEEVLDAVPRGVLKAGRAVPEFEVPALRGDTTYTPEDFEGQYVLIDFWVTWCAPCIDEMPTFRTAYDAYRKDGFTILGVSFDHRSRRVEAFLDEQPLPWPQAFVQDGFESTVARQFKVGKLPTKVLVGPDGKIVATDQELRNTGLMEVLERILG